MSPGNEIRGVVVGADFENGGGGTIILHVEVPDNVRVAYAPVTVTVEEGSGPERRDALLRGELR